MPVARSPVPERPESTHLPFGVDFQKALIKVLCEDAGFAACMTPYLKASYFEAPPLAWAYSAISEYREKYGVTPSLGTLLELTRTLTLGEATLYGSVIDSLRSVQVRDEAWLRDQTIEFVKRGVFAKAFLEARELFNTGKYTNAYDTMMAKMDELRSIQPEVPDRGFFFDELPRRQSERLGSDPTLDSIGTGIGWLDKILDGGLSLGELGLWLAYAKGGKALRNDQPVLTPTGWKPIGSLRVGDEVIGGVSGRPQKVLGVFPQGVKDLYEVRFRDGASVIASGDHIWSVKTGSDVALGSRRGWRDLTTVEISGRDLSSRGGRICIPNPPAVEGCGSRLPMDGYLLGLLLGDGSLHEATVRFHKPERDLWAAIRRALPAGDALIEHVADGRAPYVSIVSGAHGRRSVTAQVLASLGLGGVVSREKFIPECVFVAPAQERFDVLSGLCDTDGSVMRTGCAVEFSSVSSGLAEGVIALARSLGGQARMVAKEVRGVTYWRVWLRLLDGRVPVRSEKNSVKSRVRTKSRHRYVKSVTPVAPGECTCIVVDDPGHLFITSGYVVTHNSTMLTTLGVNATRICSRRVLHCVFEGSRKQVELRYDTAFVRENYGKVKRGDISHDGFMSMQREYDFLKHKLVVRGFTDSWDYTVMHVQDELRELKQRHGFVPELIIIDYGDLLGGRDKHYHNETAKQQAAYRDLKSLSNRGYAVWTASQAQRPKEGAEDSAHLLKSRDIADAYAKVRVADFIGSLNQTRDERKQGSIRLYAELYRDNAAEQILVARSDFSQMRIWAEPGARGTFVAGKNGTPALGYEGIPTQPRVAL